MPQRNLRKLLSHKVHLVQVVLKLRVRILMSLYAECGIGTFGEKSAMTDIDKCCHVGIPYYQFIDQLTIMFKTCVFTLDGAKTCIRNNGMMWDTTKKSIFFDAINEVLLFFYC